MRITHLPSGIVVSCQNERSQMKNRVDGDEDPAPPPLRPGDAEAAEEQAKREGEKADIAWGSQIRSYVLQPYRMVKDHRTGFEMGDADRVLDGDIDPFIESWLSHQMGDAEAKAS